MRIFAVQPMTAYKAPSFTGKPAKLPKAATPAPQEQPQTDTWAQAFNTSFGAIEYGLGLPISTITATAI